MRRCTHYTPVYFALSLAAIIWIVVMPPLLQRFSNRRRQNSSNQYGKYVPEPTVADLSLADVSLKPVASPSIPEVVSVNPYDGAAFVTLAGGDASARNLVALVQSLRDVGTKLPIVILLARGGLGSAVCIDNDWKKKMGRPDVNCGGPDTIG